MILSTLVERAVASQILHCVTANNLVPKLQVAYRRHHLAEVILNVLSVVLFVVHRRTITSEALLDLNATFNREIQSVLQ